MNESRGRSNPSFLGFVVENDEMVEWMVEWMVAAVMGFPVLLKDFVFPCDVTKSQTR
jgi:hypothetical protein